MSATKAEIAWAAGIFEGEGSVVISSGHVRLVVKMTDEDVIGHLHRVLGGSIYGPYQYAQPDGSQRKPFWVWNTDSSDVRRTARQLEPWPRCRKCSGRSHWGGIVSDGETASVKAAELAIVAARKVVSPFGSPDAVRVLAYRVNGYSDFIRFRPDRWQPQSDLV